MKKQELGLSENGAGCEETMGKKLDPATQRLDGPHSSLSVQNPVLPNFRPLILLFRQRSYFPCCPPPLMTGLNPSPQTGNDGWSKVVGTGEGEAGICAALSPVNFTNFKVLWLVTSYLNKVVESILASCALCTLGLEGSREDGTGAAGAEALALGSLPVHWDLGLGAPRRWLARASQAPRQAMQGFRGLPVEIPEPSG